MQVCRKELTMQKNQTKKSAKKKELPATPSFSKPVWGDVSMSCDECKSNDQDIDTFPCAKCHTRH